jgi:hypothetical protein
MHVAPAPSAAGVQDSRRDADERVRPEPVNRTWAVPRAVGAVSPPTSARVKEAPDARVSMGPIPPVAAEAATTGGTNEAASERERGQLTFQGGFGYRPPADAKAARVPLARVWVAGTLDCREGRGSVYYRDNANPSEWQSSHFAFDAGSVCYTDRADLTALAARFHLSVTGAYSPLTPDLVVDAQGGGHYALRFVGTDPAGTPLPSMMFCLALQGGAYGSYRLPQNANRPADAPGCTFLDTFAVKRTR